MKCTSKLWILLIDSLLKIAIVAQIPKQEDIVYVYMCLCKCRYIHNTNNLENSYIVCQFLFWNSTVKMCFDLIVKDVIHSRALGPNIHLCLQQETVLKTKFQQIGNFEVPCWFLSIFSSNQKKCYWHSWPCLWKWFTIIKLRPDFFISWFTDIFGLYSISMSF